MSLTLIIVIMTCIISYQAFEDIGMKQKLNMYPASVKSNGEFYRFLTSGFVHNGWGHLLINMYVLYTFGEMIEGYFNQIYGGGIGRILFIILYFGAVTISSIPDYIKYQNHPRFTASGASGGTSAIIFAFIFFNPWGWFLFPPLPGVLLAIAYLMYSSYMSKRGGDNIGHDAHMWGAVYGAVFMALTSALMKPELLTDFLDLFLEGPSMPSF